MPRHLDWSASTARDVDLRDRHQRARFYEVVLREERVLRVPVLGLRLVPDQFMAQVVQAHRRWSVAAA